MSDLKSDCDFIGCSIHASFNYKDKFYGRFCLKHKEPDMVIINKKTCQEPNCSIRPSFNFKHEKIGIYCLKHKENDMINIVGKTCIHDTCNKRSSFNNKGKRPLFCYDHKEPQMINVNNKQCLIDTCYNRAYWGLPGNSVEYCYDHYSNSMMKYPKRKCLKESCNDIAIWGLGKPKHCNQHKIRGDYNLIEGRCFSCGLEYILNKDGICFLCQDFTKIKPQRLIKQKNIKALIDNTDIKIFSYDRIIDSSCNLKRPDFVFEDRTSDHPKFVVLEIDEHQHRSNYTCNNKRMLQICQALGLPTTFIRYNPDNFKTGGKQIFVSMKDRNDNLLYWIKYLMNYKPKYQLSVVYLYYDNWIDNEHTKINQIDHPGYINKIYYNEDTINQYIDSLLIDLSIK